MVVKVFEDKNMKIKILLGLSLSICIILLSSCGGTNVGDPVGSNDDYSNGINDQDVFDDQTNKSIEDEKPSNSSRINKTKWNIGFISVDNGMYEIYKVNFDGQDKKLLGKVDLELNHVIEPSWATNGNRILVVVNDYPVKKDLYIIEVDGTTSQLLVEDVFIQVPGPIWSPDGGKIAFASTGIHILNSDGSGERILPNNNGSADNPSWSLDGTRIAYRSIGVDRDTGIYVMNIDGTGEYCLTNGRDDDRPSWSPDGRQIVFDSYRGESYDIYVVNVDGTEEKRLTFDETDNYYPSWSPDGNKIVYRSNDGEKNVIYVINSDGSNRVCISCDLPNSLNPKWSPDGKLILFDSDCENIYVANPDGSGRKEIFSGKTTCLAPVWVP